MVERYRLVEFGSTMLGVESAQSDLDLLITTFDCLISRDVFFHAVETLLKNLVKVKDLIIIRSANVPLVKFKFDGVKVDLIFAEMITPSFLKT